MTPSSTAKAEPQGRNFRTPCLPRQEHESNFGVGLARQSGFERIEAAHGTPDTPIIPPALRGKLRVFDRVPNMGVATEGRGRTPAAERRNRGLVSEFETNPSRLAIDLDIKIHAREVV